MPAPKYKPVDGKESFMAPTPQKCYNQVTDPKKGNVEACERCMKKRSGRGKVCYQPKKTPQHILNKMKHEKGRTIQVEIEKQQNLKHKNPDFFAQNYEE